MALTAAQMLEIRTCVGDYNLPYDISNTTLEAIYADPQQGDLSADRTKVFALRLRWGLAINAVNDTGNITGINSQNSAKQAQIKTLLDYWENVCGMAAGQIIGATTTTLTTRADQTRLRRLFAWQADGYGFASDWDAYND